MNTRSDARKACPPRGCSSNVHTKTYTVDITILLDKKKS